MKVGYARVSTKHKQNIDMQVSALEEQGCEKIFKDEGISGTKRERPGLNEMLSYVRVSRLPPHVYNYLVSFSTPSIQKNYVYSVIP